MKGEKTMASPYVPGGLALLEAPSRPSTAEYSDLPVIRTHSTDAIVPMLDWPTDLFKAFAVQFDDDFEYR